MYIQILKINNQNQNQNYFQYYLIQFAEYNVLQHNCLISKLSNILQFEPIILKTPNYKEIKKKLNFLVFEKLIHLNRFT